MISPGWCCDFSFEGLIACGFAYLLRLVDSRVVADGCFRSSDHDFLVVALDTARVEGYIAWGKVEPYPEDVIERRGGELERFLITRYARWDVDGRGDGVFDVGKELLLRVEPCPGMFERVWACAPRIAHTYVRIESLRRSTPTCVKPSEVSGMNVVQALEMSQLCLIESLGWKKGPSE